MCVVPWPRTHRVRHFRSSSRSVYCLPSSRRAAGKRRSRTIQRVAAPDSADHPAGDQRTIVRVVGQPSFIEAYERTSVFPKLSAYIQKWIVDIGDRVKKGDILATLFVPELVEDFGHEEGHRQSRHRTGEAGQQDGGSGRRRRQGGGGAVDGGQGNTGQVPGRGGSVGHRGQAIRATR